MTQHLYKVINKGVVMEKLIFSQSPVITFASNTFIDVPVILQYENTPLVEVGQIGKSTFGTKIPIYDLNGVYLAKIVGSRIVKTPEGEKAGVQLRHYKDLIVCELMGKTVVESRYTGPLALSMSAELYTPDGMLIKAPDAYPIELFSADGKDQIEINGNTIKNCTFQGFRIAIQVMKDGSLSLGIS
jgi:hypothetical protein